MGAVGAVGAEVMIISVDRHLPAIQAMVVMVMRQCRKPQIIRAMVEAVMRQCRKLLLTEDVVVETSQLLLPQHIIEV